MISYFPGFPMAALLWVSSLPSHFEDMVFAAKAWTFHHSCPKLKDFQSQPQRHNSPDLFLLQQPLWECPVVCLVFCLWLSPWPWNPSPTHTHFERPLRIQSRSYAADSSKPAFFFSGNYAILQFLVILDSPNSTSWYIMPHIKIKITQNSLEV